MLVTKLNKLLNVVKTEYKSIPQVEILVGCFHYSIYIFAQYIYKNTKSYVNRLLTNEPGEESKEQRGNKLSSINRSISVIKVFFTFLEDR